MPYEKQTFKDGEVLTAAQLNHMEDGIHALSENFDIDKIATAVIDALPMYNGEVETA